MCYEVWHCSKIYLPESVNFTLQKQFMKKRKRHELVLEIRCAIFFLCVLSSSSAGSSDSRFVRIARFNAKGLFCALIAVRIG